MYEEVRLLVNEKFTYKDGSECEFYYLGEQKYVKGFTSVKKAWDKFCSWMNDGFIEQCKVEVSVYGEIHVTALFDENENQIDSETEDYHYKKFYEVWFEVIESKYLNDINEIQKAINRE